MHRLLIAAAHKSSGKTTVAIGLAAALRQRGLTVQPFKKGPDYIDPLWLGEAAGRSCRNLDFNISPPAELQRQFALGADADVRLVEGNMALHDGLAADGGDSNAGLARLLDLPVLLVIDARGMTRSIAPLLLGFQAFDRRLAFAGVILNRIGGCRHESKLRAAIEQHSDLKVLGALHEDEQLRMVERHLGLLPANEAADAAAQISRIAARIGAAVDLDALLAASAAPAAAAAAPSIVAKAPPPELRIAIARDAAFGFYYPDDIDAFAAAGAQLLPFDALRDEQLPPCDGLFIGGGFPESFLPQLAANTALRRRIAAAVAAGLPTYAECGGLMYLARSIRWHDESWPMVGCIDADVVMHDKPVGRGYVRLAPTPQHPWPDAGINAGDADDGEVRGHEFHYSELRGLPPQTRFAWTVKRGHGVDGRHDGVVVHNLLASYSHLRAVAGCDWPARFTDFVRRHKALSATEAPTTRENAPCSA